jgi:hypothetical protein
MTRQRCATGGCISLPSSSVWGPLPVSNGLFFRPQRALVDQPKPKNVVGYDTSVIGGTMALDSFRNDFGISRVTVTARDTLQGNIVSTFQAGCFFGSLLTFPLAERFGRKIAITIATSIFLVGGSLMVSCLGKPPAGKPTLTICLDGLVRSCELDLCRACHCRLRHRLCLLTGACVHR